MKKTMLDFLNEVSEEKGFTGWYQVYATQDTEGCNYIPQMAGKRYAKQVAEQALKDAAERATAHKESRFPSVDYCECYVVVDKNSILSTPITNI